MLHCKGVDVKFGFISKRRNVWPGVWLCEALGVSRSGFHAWLGHGPSERARTDEALMPLTRSSLTTSSGAYGARRVGGTYWRRGRRAVCTGSSSPCSPMPLGRGPGGGGRSPVMTQSDQQPPSCRMCSTGSFRPISRTANGSPTSPTSGRPKDGSMLRPEMIFCRISSLAVSPADR